MSSRHQWTDISCVNLTKQEKRDLIEFCEIRQFKCRCSEVDQAGSKCQNFCTLCDDIVNGRPEPLIRLDKESKVTVRELFASQYYKSLKLRIKYLILG